MNENIQEFLVNTASIFIFIMALALFFTINEGITYMNDVIEGTQTSERTLYESQVNSEEAYVTGAQIIFSIRTGLESDIEVDHATILKDIDPNTYDYTWIDVNRSYHVIKSINELGQINKIIYNKM